MSKITNNKIGMSKQNENKEKENLVFFSQHVKYKTVNNKNYCKI